MCSGKLSDMTESAQIKLNTICRSQKIRLSLRIIIDIIYKTHYTDKSKLKNYKFNAVTIIGFLKNLI